MKKVVSVLIVLVLILGSLTMLTACNTSVDGMKYTLAEDEDGNEYYIAKLYTDAESRTAVEIPDEIEGIPVKELAVSCFTQCSYMTSLYIGKNVETISNWAITNNTYLASITVDPENEYFTSEDGILYSKDFTQLIAYPNAKDATYNTLGALTSSTTTVIIREGVVEITDEAFYNCSAIGEVVFASTVKTVGGLAFLDCTNITSVQFNEGLESFGENCFLGCTNKSFTSINLPSTIKYLEDGTFYACPLATIYIAVTEAELADIVFKEGWYPCSGGKVITGNLIGLDFTIEYKDFKGEK